MRNTVRENGKSKVCIFLVLPSMLSFYFTRIMGLAGIKNNWCCFSSRNKYRKRGLLRVNKNGKRFMSIFLCFASYLFLFPIKFRLRWLVVLVTLLMANLRKCSYYRCIFPDMFYHKVNKAKLSRLIPILLLCTVLCLESGLLYAL